MSSIYTKRPGDPGYSAAIANALAQMDIAARELVAKHKAEDAAKGVKYRAPSWGWAGNRGESPAGGNHD
jgi:hypothetical protein